MRDHRTRWAMRILPVATALIVGACGGGATATPGATATVGSPPAPTAAAPTAAAPAAAVTQAPTAAVTQAPTAEPPTTAPTATQVTSATTPPAHEYTCAKLLTDKEMVNATGLGDAALFLGRNGTPAAKGQTYCQFLARKGATAIAVAVWTGPSLKDFGALWDSAAGATSVPGIGDGARISAEFGAGGAYVHGIGISVAFAATGDDGLKGIDLAKAIEAILRILAGRV